MNIQLLLEFVNRLPLDKDAKLLFIKDYISTLKKEDEETAQNKKQFNKVLEQIKISA